MPTLHKIRSVAKTTTARLRTTTARLALSYLAIIMLMSIGFSVVFYNASLHELRRPPHPTNSQMQLDNRPHPERDPFIASLLKTRAEEGRKELLKRLIGLNLIALVAGTALSYYLARRTLEPIERNMEAQAQFVSDASHELRTPLTALQTTNEVALRKHKLSESEARDLLAHNVAEVAKLQALTDGLLRLARPDRTMQHVPVALQNAASDAMNALIEAAQAKNISIEEAVPNVRVLGDEPSIVQAIKILLDNAVKYSPQDSHIKLTGGRSGRQGFITVQDHGQGIAAKDLPHIFDRFYRADQSRGKHAEDGYGIGLSLAKKLVHQMDGEIVVTSTPGKGSTFTIRLPLTANQ